MKNKMVVIGLLMVMSSMSLHAKVGGNLGDKALRAGSELAAGLMDGKLDTKDIARAGVHMAADMGAVPVAVYGAGALGVEATTGTAIATLNGAAAVSATSYAIGAPVATAIGTLTGIVIAPSVVGGAIIVGTASLLAVGVNTIFFDD